MADDTTLPVLRAEAFRYVGAVGGLLAASLAAAISFGGVTAAQSLAALIAYAALALATLGALVAHLPQRRFGAANALTLARGAMVAALAGLLAAPIDSQLSWVAASLAMICIALDGIDGWLARRFATVSPFGARFDMEVDAALILVLSILIAASGKVGAWVLLVGAARYLFVAAGRRLPALKAPLPYSERRRAVCVFQGLALVAALIPILPVLFASVVCAAGLVATAYSFGVDCLRLLQNPAVPSAD
jgi:phosphatidylglycerophosphate synthase